MKKILVLLTMALLASSAVSQTGRVEPANSRDPIPGIGQMWAKYWDAKQLDKVIDLYAPDAEFLSSAGRISGKPAIEAFFRKVSGMVVSTKEKVRMVSHASSGDLAFESGDYSEDIVLKDRTNKEKGAYVIVLKRIGGRWLILQQVWTDETQPDPVVLKKK